jgi:hypothetical protein
LGWTDQNAHEPIYKDRLTEVLVRKDMSDLWETPRKNHPKEAISIPQHRLLARAFQDSQLLAQRQILDYQMSTQASPPTPEGNPVEKQCNHG